TDIYAMGLVLYELLAQRPAITGDSEATLMGRAAMRDFPAIETLRPDVPAEVRTVLERALALNIEDRYANAGLMAHDLEDHLARSGTRVRPSEMAALLSPGTSATGVGLKPAPQSNPRAMATPIGAYRPEPVEATRATLPLQNDADDENEHTSLDS